MRFPRALTALALGAVLAAPAVLPASADEPRPMISIVGHGEVTARPDTATVASGVTTQAQTAAEALAANTRAMTSLVDALKGAGIAEKDIQTSGFSVNPQYVYPENGRTDPPRIAGYQVVNSVTVRITSLGTLGTILDKMVGVGANTINGIGFSVSDPADLYDQARREAVRDARHKAQLYASAAGLALGDIVSLSERSASVPPQPYMVKSMAAEAARPVPVEAGELTFSVDVSMQWAIKPVASQ